MGGSKVGSKKIENLGAEKERDYIYSAIDLTKELGRYPSVAELANHIGEKRVSVRHYFNSDADLVDAMIKTKPELAKSYFGFDDFGSAQEAEVSEVLRKHKRFFITAAEPDKPLWNNGAAAKTILQWCKKRKAAPLLLSLGQDLTKLHGSLIDFHVITKPVDLNNNLRVLPILTSNTAVNPSSGLARTIGTGSHSVIYGATKLSQESIPTDIGKLAHSLISTGCITNAEYKKRNATLMSKSIYTASRDHEISGVIVELVDDDYFFVKVCQFDVKGEMVELTKKGAFRYFPDGKVTREFAISFQPGDSHVEEADPVVEKSFMDIAKIAGAKSVALHDIFSYRGPSHHNANDKVAQAKILENGWTLAKDIKLVHKFLNKWADIVDDVVVVRSNHDEHIGKAVKTGQLDNPATYRTYLEMALAMMDGKDPLEHAISLYAGPLQKNVRFLKDRERWVFRNKFGELIMHLHGDLGSDGARGAGTTGTKSLATAVASANVGHSHSPRIIPGNGRNGMGNSGIFVAGTTDKMHDMPGYTSGPSSWMNSGIVTFGDPKNGGRFLRTLVTIIKNAEGKADWSLD